MNIQWTAVEYADNKRIGVHACKTLFGVQEQNSVVLGHEIKGRKCLLIIFMKWNLFPEEIKGEDEWIRRWLQEKYSFVETDTATTVYHFLCNIKNLVFIILQNVIKNYFKAIFVGFFFRNITNKQTNKQTSPRMLAFTEFWNPDLKIAAVFC